MSDTNRDIFIALIDAGLDESTILSFIEGASVDAAAIIEALGTDALCGLVWQRADRQSADAGLDPTVTLAETEAMIESVLEQEGREDRAGRPAAIERTGRSSNDVRSRRTSPSRSAASAGCRAGPRITYCSQPRRSWCWS